MKRARLVLLVAACTGQTPPDEVMTTSVVTTGPEVTGSTPTSGAPATTGGAGQATSSTGGPTADPTEGADDPCAGLDEAACDADDACVIRKGPSCPGCDDAVFQACTSVAIGVCDRAESACPGLAACDSPAGDACAACVADPEPCPGAAFPAREDSPYILPYPTGTTRNIRQGNCNESNTHNGGEAYAYDVEMPIGSDLIAARGGTVLAVIEEFHDDQHGLDQGNVVAIDHGDRTYAKYGHITYMGALVEVGEVVVQGQVIAKSGDSGASQGPHCHFAVKACPDDAPIGSAACVSVPVSFRNTIPHPHGLIGSPTSQIGGGAWYPACAWSSRWTADP